jgi:hypothetical protein
MDREPDVGNTAPVGSIDLDAADEDGEPYEIRPPLVRTVVRRSTA